MAFVHERSLHVVELADGAVTRLAGEDQPDVSWGVAEFVAAEEMHRDRGYWWSPDGDALLVARVDESAVRSLWISDAANPGISPARRPLPDGRLAERDPSRRICSGSTGRRVCA